MKFLLFLVALAIVALIVTGAITLTRTADQKITIEIDKDRVKQDAAAALKKGRDVLRGAESRLRQANRQERAD